MKTLSQILIILIAVSSCKVSKQDSFYTFLGSEKARVIEKTSDHFDHFLSDNFEGANNLQRTIGLLTYIDTCMRLTPNWKFDLSLAEDIVTTYEESGLRKDFEIYGYEEYDSVFFYDVQKDSSSIKHVSSIGTLEIEVETDPYPEDWDSLQIARYEESIGDYDQHLESGVDSSLHYNLYGRYEYGLTRYFHHDSIVLEYIDAIHLWGHSLVRQSLARGLRNELESSQELTESIRMIIMFEFYLPYLRRKIKTADN